MRKELFCFTWHNKSWSAESTCLLQQLKSAVGNSNNKITKAYWKNWIKLTGLNLIWNLVLKNVFYDFGRLLIKRKLCVQSWPSPVKPSMHLQSYEPLKENEWEAKRHLPEAHTYYIYSSTPTHIYMSRLKLSEDDIANHMRIVVKMCIISYNAYNFTFTEFQSD